MLKAMSVVLVGVLMVIVAVGCGGQQAASTPTPVPTTAPTVPAGGTPGTMEPWEEEWERVLAAARMEGEVIVITPPGQIRTSSVEGFAQAFPEIRLRTESVHIRDLAARLALEQDNGRFLYDICYGCIGVPVYNEWLPNNRVVSLRDKLILPEVTDESVWTGGWDAVYADSAGQYLFGFVSNVTGGPLYVNRDILPESEFPSTVSLRELGDPKWRGKIIWNDPGAPGAGSTVPATMVALGMEDLIQTLFTEQDVIIAASNLQATEMIVRGVAPLAIGVGAPELDEFQRQGVGTNIHIAEFEEYMQESYGFAVAAMPRNGPHPNAAIVFLNWFLSQEGQRQHTEITGDNSRRVDVPPAPRQVEVPPGANLLNMQTEENNVHRDRSQTLITQLLN